MNKILKQKKGVTLIELLVVVLVIGVLAAIVIPSYDTAAEKARVAEATIGIRAIEMAARERLMPSMRFFETNSLNDIHPVLTSGEMNGSGQWVTRNWTFSISGTTSSWVITATRNHIAYSLKSTITRGGNGFGVAVEHRCIKGSTREGKYICKYLKPEGWKS